MPERSQPKTPQEVVAIARRASHLASGRCSMCGAGDYPSHGLHRGQYRCGNEDACIGCKGALPPGEQCAACGRINMRDESGGSA